jgi:hypothetical protein
MNQVPVVHQVIGGLTRVGRFIVGFPGGGLMASIEDLASEAESIEIVKADMPKLAGQRCPVSIYISHGTSLCFEGSIIENVIPHKLAHDFKISGLSIFHVAELRLIGADTYELTTKYAHAKENAAILPIFYGRLTKTEEGYEGDVELSCNGNLTTHFWEIVRE